MSTVPSATCCRPVPEPPPLTVTEQSGFRALKASAASWARGCRAEEPEAVTVPETVAAASLEESPLSWEAVELLELS